MSTNPLSHPLWSIELGVAVVSTPLLVGVIVFQVLPGLLVGALLGLVGGALLGVGVTLAVSRWAVTQARRTTPAGLLLDEPIEGEWREISL